MLTFFDADMMVVLAIAGILYILAVLLFCRVLGFSNCPFVRETEDSSTLPAVNPSGPEITLGIDRQNKIQPEELQKNTVEVCPKCRARRLIYTSEFVQCLTESDAGCEHRLPYGRVYFCYHPRREEVVKQTEFVG